MMSYSCRFTVELDFDKVLAVMNFIYLFIYFFIFVSHFLKTDVKSKWRGKVLDGTTTAPPH